MREILFRGKRLDNGEWVYGYYVHIGPVSCQRAYIIPEYTSAIYVKEVDPSTVDQYTGLMDKNDKRIFDGDILSIPFEEDRSPYEENSIYYEKGEVYFDTKRYGWYVRFHEYNDEISLWEYDNTDIEVISNIYDNPELLKGGNQRHTKKQSTGLKILLDTGMENTEKHGTWQSPRSASWMHKRSIGSNGLA